MRKYSFILVLFIVLFFGIKGKAITQQELHDWLLTQNIDISGYGYETTFYNEAVAQYGANGFAICYCTGYQNSRYTLILAAYDKNMYSGMTYYNRTWLYNNSTNYTTKGSQFRCNLTNNILTVDTRSSTFTTYCELPAYWQTELQHGNTNFVPPVDWENPLYSIAIETPNFDVTYRNIMYDQVDVPLNVNLNVSQTTQLYCEVMAEYTLPTNLQYKYSSNSFEASQYTRISKTIVTNEEMVLARTLNASGLYAILKNKYAECLQEIPLSSVSIRFPSDFSAQDILNARQTYDELRQVCTVGGTAIKIYIRYFAIENQTQFVVGAWRIWNSTNPKSFGVELPSWYQPYIPASGETGTNSTIETDPDVVVIPAGGQTPTGQYYDPSINITVGSNVPNYPDYPTIASYNLDNMLVDTMNNVKGLSSFFGEFGSFLTVSFSFFPSWIWAIIGVGFGISIVVMFLKIL